MNSLGRLPTFFLVLCGIFSLPLLSADVSLLGKLARQLFSATYPAVEGMITHSEQVVEEYSDEGRRQLRSRFSLKYVYEVDGKQYQGTRHRYTEGFEGDVEARMA